HPQSVFECDAPLRAVVRGAPHPRARRRRTPSRGGLYQGTAKGVFGPHTVKQHLAALRMLFDWLVMGHVLDVNPAHAVRGPKYVVKKGKTPVLTAEEARELLDSILI